MCNLSNLNTALRGGVLNLIEAQLMCVGGGPTLDYESAAEFLAGVRADDREGAQAAAAMMDVARCGGWGTPGSLIARRNFRECC